MAPLKFTVWTCIPNKKLKNEILVIIQCVVKWTLANRKSLFWVENTFQKSYQSKRNTWEILAFPNEPTKNKQHNNMKTKSMNSVKPCPPKCSKRCHSCSSQAAIKLYLLGLWAGVTCLAPWSRTALIWSGPLVEFPANLSCCKHSCVSW